MSKKLVQLICLGVVTFTLAACVVKTREQLKSDDDGNYEARKQTASQQREEAKAQKPYKEKAPATGFRFEEIDEQIRAMNGRVDTVENRIGQMDAAAASEKTSVTSMATAIDAKFLAYEEEMKKMAAQIQTLNDEVARLRAGGSSSTPSGAATTAKASRSAYDDAEEMFNKKQWKEAIVDYQKYRDANPKGKMYADATYKIGVCFQELKMKDEAKAFFDEVIAKSPNSKEAKKAAFRMKSLK